MNKIFLIYLFALLSLSIFASATTKCDELNGFLSNLQVVPYNMVLKLEPQNLYDNFLQCATSNNAYDFTAFVDGFNQTLQEKFVDVIAGVATPYKRMDEFISKFLTPVLGQSNFTLSTQPTSEEIAALNSYKNIVKCVLTQAQSLSRKYNYKNVATNKNLAPFFNLGKEFEYTVMKFSDIQFFVVLKKEFPNGSINNYDDELIFEIPLSLALKSVKENVNFFRTYRQTFHSISNIFNDVNMLTVVIDAVKTNVANLASCDDMLSVMYLHYFNSAEYSNPSDALKNNMIEYLESNKDNLKTDTRALKSGNRKLFLTDASKFLDIDITQPDVRQTFLTFFASITGPSVEIMVIIKEMKDFENLATSNLPLLKAILVHADDADIVGAYVIGVISPVSNSVVNIDFLYEGEVYDANIVDDLRENPPTPTNIMTLLSRVDVRGKFRNRLIGYFISHQAFEPFFNFLRLEGFTEKEALDYLFQYLANSTLNLSPFTLDQFAINYDAPNKQFNIMMNETTFIHIAVDESVIETLRDRIAKLMSANPPINQTLAATYCHCLQSLIAGFQIDTIYFRQFYDMAAAVSNIVEMYNETGSTVPCDWLSVASIKSNHAKNFSLLNQNFSVTLGGVKPVITYMNNISYTDRSMILNDPNVPNEVLAWYYSSISPEEALSSIRNITQKSSKKFDIEFLENPLLVNGAIVKIDSDLFEFSIAGNNTVLINYIKDILVVKNEISLYTSACKYNMISLNDVVSFINDMNVTADVKIDRLYTLFDDLGWAVSGQFLVNNLINNNGYTLFGVNYSFSDAQVEKIEKWEIDNTNKTELPMSLIKQVESLISKHSSCISDYIEELNTTLVDWNTKWSKAVDYEQVFKKLVFDFTDLSKLNPLSDVDSLFCIRSHASFELVNTTLSSFSTFDPRCMLNSKHMSLNPEFDKFKVQSDLRSALAGAAKLLTNTSHSIDDVKDLLNFDIISSSSTVGQCNVSLFGHSYDNITEPSGSSLYNDYNTVFNYLNDTALYTKAYTFGFHPKFIFSVLCGPKSALDCLDGAYNSSNNFTDLDMIDRISAISLSADPRVLLNWPHFATFLRIIHDYLFATLTPSLNSQILDALRTIWLPQSLKDRPMIEEKFDVIIAALKIINLCVPLVQYNHKFDDIGLDFNFTSGEVSLFGESAQITPKHSKYYADIAELLDIDLTIHLSNTQEFKFMKEAIFANANNLTTAWDYCINASDCKDYAETIADGFTQSEIIFFGKNITYDGSLATNGTIKDMVLKLASHKLFAKTFEYGIILRDDFTRYLPCSDNITCHNNLVLVVGNLTEPKACELIESFIYDSGLALKFKPNIIVPFGSANDALLTLHSKSVAAWTPTEQDDFYNKLRRFWSKEAAPYSVVASKGFFNDLNNANKELPKYYSFFNSSYFYNDKLSITFHCSLPTITYSNGSTPMAMASIVVGGSKMNVDNTNVVSVLNILCSTSVGMPTILSCPVVHNDDLALEAIFSNLNNTLNQIIEYAQELYAHGLRREYLFILISSTISNRFHGDITMECSNATGCTGSAYDGKFKLRSSKAVIDIDLSNFNSSLTDLVAQLMPSKVRDTKPEDGSNGSASAYFVNVYALALTSISMLAYLYI